MQPAHKRGRARAVHPKGQQVAGSAQHFRRRRGIANAPAVHHHEHVGIFRKQGYFLLDCHHRGTMLARIARQKVEHRHRTGRVKLCRRLVEHQHARAQSQNGRNGHLLLLPARKRVDGAAAQIGDAHGVERVGNARLYFGLRHAEVLKAVEHLVFHCGRHHLAVDILTHASHHARHLRELAFAGIEPAHAHRSVEIARIAVRDDAVHGIGERRFARTCRSDYSHERTIGYG